MGRKNFSKANEPNKLTEVAILMSDKVDFRLKSIRRDNEGHFILMKGTIHQKEISILNIYAPNMEAPSLKKNNNSNGLKNTDRC
jgi:hypothetical protein